MNCNVGQISAAELVFAQFDINLPPQVSNSVFPSKLRKQFTEGTIKKLSTRRSRSCCCEGFGFSLSIISIGGISKAGNGIFVPKQSIAALAYFLNYFFFSFVRAEVSGR